MVYLKHTYEFLATMVHIWDAGFFSMLYRNDIVSLYYIFDEVDISLYYIFDEVDNLIFVLPLYSHVYKYFKHTKMC